MRMPPAIRLILAAILFSQPLAVAFGQSTPSEPLKVNACELVKGPSRFAGSFVKFRSEFVSRFEWEGVVDETCSAKIQIGGFHVYDDLKPEQGEYAFTKMNDDNTHPERLDWKPITPPFPVDLKRDGNYRRFREYADTKFKWSDGGVCQDCP